MKIMAVDYGDTRTGLAVCDRTEFLASPVGVIEERNFYFTIQKVAHAVKEYDVQMVVVGYPVNMNGTVGPRRRMRPVCRAFEDQSGCTGRTVGRTGDDAGSSELFERNGHLRQKAEGSHRRSRGDDYPRKLYDLPA